MRRLVLFCALIVLSITAYGQTLMLTVRKAAILCEMKYYSEYELIVHAKDYLEYESKERVIAYRFKGRHCSEIYLVLDKDAADQFIVDREGTHWKKTETGWLYYSGMFEEPIIVTKIEDISTTTFIYRLK